jgi:hypothetical protein
VSGAAAVTVVNPEALILSNGKAAEGGAYGINEPFRHRVLAVAGGETRDISASLGPGDFNYNFSIAGTKTVSLSPSSSLYGVPCSSVSVEVKDMLHRVAWANGQGGAHTLLLYANESMPGVTMLQPNITNAAITIKSGDESPAGMRTLSLGSVGSIFHVDETSSVDAKLILGRNLTLLGIPGNDAPVVRVNNSGELVMEDGSVITGNTYTVGAGGGVQVGTNCRFIMNGGVISGNEGDHAGGVSVANGTFIMNGGTISGNVATNTGGGVYTVAGGTFTMNGGPIGGTTLAEKNTASGGGGVSLYGTGGTFTMNGGTISGNEATGTGLTGGGGGVCVFGSWAFEMNGGTISGNKTAQNGGGVFVRFGSFTMNNSASVRGNTVTGSSSAEGGGVYVNTGTSFTMNGSASVSNNTVTGSGINSGGGVYVNSGASFGMSGSASVSGNTATGSNTSIGGGVYVSSGAVTMNGGVIGGDEAAEANTAVSGGGVYINGSSASFLMTGGTISGNVANGPGPNDGGGGVYMYDGGFTMNSNSASISSNRATGASSKGGGVHVYDGNFTLTQGWVYGTTHPTLQNTAGMYGNAVYKTSMGACSVTLPEGGGTYANTTISQ